MHLSVCKLFTFSPFSPELPGQFQLNLAQSILERRRLKFVPKEIDNKIAKIH